MMKKNIWFWLLVGMLSACTKQQEWLDVKSNKSDVVPSTLVDLQAVLDNDMVLNSAYPSLPLLSSDHYYLSYANWQGAATATERNAYLWNSEIYEGAPGYDWKSAYQRVALANVVLDGLKKIGTDGKGQALYGWVKGTALFHRSMAFFQLIQGFSLSFSPSNASAMGIPLKLSSDINEVVFRAGLAESYQQVLDDLRQAVELLPVSVTVKTRPSQQAGLILLAKVQLAHMDYSAALATAEQALKLNSELLDFNNVDGKIEFPFPTYQQKHKEVVFHATTTSLSLFRGDRMLVDPLLYQNYQLEDLRKVLFYKEIGLGAVQFRGHYSGENGNFFAGLGVNELSLIKAECMARLGDHLGAITELNRLLVKRFRSGSFVPVVATSAVQALGMVLLEREKELPFTGSLRWEDLKRLNAAPNFARTIRRTLNGQLFELRANDPRYIFPIPEDEIRLTKIPQNER